MSNKYGIELEFFVREKETNNIVPAYTATNNTDGNPVIGEIKTDVHENIVDCVFELKKLLYLEKETLSKKGYILTLDPIVKIDNDFIKLLRKDIKYINRKEPQLLDEKSIYLSSTGKVNPRGVYKASLQLNISNNEKFHYTKYNKITIREEYTYDTESDYKQYSQVFDYITPIVALDKAFSKDIKETNRVKGVYAIKDGNLGKRIEYRSLPNTIDLTKLIEVITNLK